jgi:hypothetical protein
LFKKPVLFRDQALNVSQNGSIVFLLFHGVSSLRLKLVYALSRRFDCAQAPIVHGSDDNENR